MSTPIPDPWPFALPSRAEIERFSLGLASGDPRLHSLLNTDRTEQEIAAELGWTTAKTSRAISMIIDASRRGGVAFTTSEHQPQKTPGPPNGGTGRFRGSG